MPDAPEAGAAAPARAGLGRRVAAEGIGTFCLVLAGTGAIAVDGAAGASLGHGGVAAAFGLAVAAMIFAVGHISGAHLNPAVSLAFAAGRHFPWREVGPYAAAQVAGALAASLALAGLLGRAGGLGATHPGLVDAAQALVVEAGMTVALVVVILAVATDTRAAGQLAAIAVGATVGLAALVFGPVTGASMNPARSLGPALVEGDASDLWIYLAGPPAGALLGAAMYEMLRGRSSAAAEPDG